MLRNYACPVEVSDRDKPASRTHRRWHATLTVKVLHSGTWSQTTTFVLQSLHASAADLDETFHFHANAGAQPEYIGRRTKTGLSAELVIAALFCTKAHKHCEKEY